MNRFKPWLLLVLVFIAGIGVGAVGVRLFVHRVMFHPEIIPQKIEHDLAADLNLSPEQKAQVHQIMEKSQAQFRAMRERFHPEIAKIFKEADDQIASILTPEQRVKFEKYRAEKQKRWHSSPG